MDRDGALRAYDTLRHKRAAASAAREIDADEFLRRIGYDGEVETGEPEPQGKSDWRKRVEGGINFDPMMEYSDSMELDLSKENSDWVVTSASERMEKAQGEHRSLRDKYEKE